MTNAKLEKPLVGAEVLDEAYMDAADAFEDANFGDYGDLGLDDFIMAMKDTHVVGKVAHATHIPERPQHLQTPTRRTTGMRLLQS